jgi:hypothetical protein
MEFRAWIQCGYLGWSSICHFPDGPDYQGSGKIEHHSNSMKKENSFSLNRSWNNLCFTPRRNKEGSP